MEDRNDELSRVLATLEQIQSTLARLEERVERLEAAAPAPAVAAPAPPEAPGEAIDEETLRVIAAAVAAFLGKTAPIRGIRLVDTSRAWAQQGRATIQAWYSVSPHPR